MSAWQEKAAEAMCKTHMCPPVPVRKSQDPRHRVAACFDCQRRVAALAPVVEAEVRRGQAEALREAAAAVMPFDGRTREAKALTQWFRDRADAIETGDPR